VDRARRVIRNTTLLYVVFAAAVGSSMVVHADVLPPGSSGSNIDTCTLEKSCPPGKECLWCRTGYVDLKLCPRSLESLGFAMQCRSGGSGALQFWTELWCRDASGEVDASTIILPRDAGATLNDPTTFEQTPNINVCPAATTAAEGGGGCHVGSRVASTHTPTATLLWMTAAAWLGFRSRAGARRRSSSRRVKGRE
jgi:hypothetical protein